MEAFESRLENTLAGQIGARYAETETAGNQRRPLITDFRSAVMDVAP